MSINSDLIKAAIQPAYFYRHELPNAPLKKYGWTDGGLCPFHADNKIGSFRINTTTGAYRCFACGTSGGDVIAYVMAVHGLNFTEALAKLASDWGLSW